MSLESQSPVKIVSNEIEASYKRYARSQSLPITFSPMRRSKSRGFHSNHSPSLSCRSATEHSIIFRQSRSMEEKLHPHPKYEEPPSCIPRCLWKLNAIKYFPSYYSLERHHAYISSKEFDLETIASNLSDCLSTEHLEVTYDQHEAVVTCETTEDDASHPNPNYCKFRINLFKKAQEEDSMMPPTYLVEVQRLTGCCVEFSVLAKKLLCACRGCEYKSDVPCVSQLTIPDYLIQMLENSPSNHSPVAAW